MDKEFNPALQFDAFTGGIEDGGLRSSTSVEIVSCYILANIEEKITAKNIVDALVEGGIANYFEISNAVSKMIKNGNVIEDENGYLHLTDNCRYSVDLVEYDLPFTIREKSVELVRKIVKREINEKENKVEIKKENNQYKITMHVSGDNSDFMVLSLFVPTAAQAEVIKKKFQSHPTEVYEKLINAIFE